MREAHRSGLFLPNQRFSIPAQIYRKERIKECYISFYYKQLLDLSNAKESQAINVDQMGLLSDNKRKYSTYTLSN